MSTALWPSNRGCNKTARIARPASRPRQTRAEGSQTCVHRGGTARCEKKCEKPHRGTARLPQQRQAILHLLLQEVLEILEAPVALQGGFLDGNLQLPKSLGQNTELSLLKVKYAHVLVALGMLTNQAITRTFYISTKRNIYLKKKQTNLQAQVKMIEETKKDHSKPRVSACFPCSFPVCCCFFFAFAFLPSAFSFRLFWYCFFFLLGCFFGFLVFCSPFPSSLYFAVFFCFFCAFSRASSVVFSGLACFVGFVLFVCFLLCLLPFLYPLLLLIVTDCFLSLKGNLQVSRRNPSLVMITLYGLYVLSYSFDFWTEFMEAVTFNFACQNTWTKSYSSVTHSQMVLNLLRRSRKHHWTSPHIQAAHITPYLPNDWNQQPFGTNLHVQGRVGLP